MSVASNMTRAVFAVGPDTSLEAAARLFIRRHIGGVPVVDAQAKPVGFLTAKDLIDPDRARSEKRGVSTCYRLHGGEREAVDEGPVGSPGVVADVMTTFVVAVPITMSIEEAARLMLADDLHRLLVVEDGRIVGILSSLDVMRAFAPARA